MELLNVIANRSHGRIIAESVHEVRVWAVENPTFANMAVNVDMVLRPALKLSSGLPLIEWTDSSVDVNAGCWISWKLWARQLRGGHIAIAFEVHVVTSRAQWSNPLWEFKDIDPNDSAQEVLRVLGGIVAAMPPVPTVDISLHDAALGVQDLRLRQIHASLQAHG